MAARIHRFLGFDAFKKKSMELPFPVCLHPTTLVQMLQFWIPRSTELESGILNSIRLPILFQQFDNQDEDVTIKILSAIARYENVGDLSEEAIRNIFVNKALRAKIEQRLPDEETIVIVQDALIEEFKRAEQQLEITQEQLKDLQIDTHLKGVRINRLNQSLDQTQEKVTEEISKRVRAESELAKEKSAREELEKKIQERNAIDERRKARFKHFSLYLGLPIGLTIVIDIVLLSILSKPLLIRLEFVGVIDALLLALIFRVAFIQGDKNQHIKGWKFYKYIKWPVMCIWGVLVLAIVGIYQGAASDYKKDIWQWLRDLFSALTK